MPCWHGMRIMDVISLGVVVRCLERGQMTDVALREEDFDETIVGYLFPPGGMEKLC